jgi:hypothetical protein
MSMTDRAAIVAGALVDEFIDTLVKVAHPELQRRIADILRDEFSQERQQGVEDSRLPDP